MWNQVCCPVQGEWRQKAERLYGCQETRPSPKPRRRFQSPPGCAVNAACPRGSTQPSATEARPCRFTKVPGDGLPGPCRAGRSIQEPSALAGLGFTACRTAVCPSKDGQYEDVTDFSWLCPDCAGTCTKLSF